MNKHFASFRKLTVLIALSIFGNTLFAQDDFAFQLHKPATGELNVKSNDEILVEITFNAAAVNEVGAYIATVADGKMVGFSASTTMESPFLNTIPAKYLGEGKHMVEYMLLPSGSTEPGEALAKVAIQVLVEGSPASKNADLEGFVQSMVKAIRNNDKTTFESFCISKKVIDSMIEGIEGDSPKESGIKAELSSMDTEMVAQKLAAGFSKLQQAFIEKGADVASVRLLTVLEQDINLKMPAFSAMDMRYVIGSGHVTFIISVNVFVTETNAYLFGFRFEEGL